MDKRTYLVILFLLSFVFCMITLLAILAALQLLAPMDSELFRLIAYTTPPVSLLFAAAWTYIMNKKPQETTSSSKKRRNSAR